jgi:hypothetical protein
MPSEVSPVFFITAEPSVNFLPISNALFTDYQQEPYNINNRVFIASKWYDR